LEYISHNEEREKVQTKANEEEAEIKLNV